MALQLGVHNKVAMDSSKYNLYHGTDLRVVKMDDSTRLWYIQFAENIANKLRPYFPSDPKAICQEHFRNELTDFYRQRVMTYISRFDFTKDNCANYQHGDFYLTANIETAKSYAETSLAVGEIGYIAYIMLYSIFELGLKTFDIDKIEELKEECKIFWDFATSKPEPVVFVYDNLDLSKLYHEDGRTISPDALSVMLKYGHFRYKGEVYFDYFKMTEL